MANSRDRILLVENDTIVSDLIGRQTLQAAGYQVFVASDASAAIAKALQWAPDLIITNLNLPGLSGKDLMVALTSQGVQVPVIILAQRGLEADIMQTFRLGAADYLLLPVREAEVIAAVERVLRQGHDRRERDQLAQQLQQTNQELQSRVRELTTIFAVGKAVTSVTDPASLLGKVLEAAIRVTQADLGWFLLREDVERPFVVAAEHKLPPALGVRLNQPWDDGISSLVAMSSEILAIYGEPLKRFKIYSLGQSALIVPIKLQQKKVIGLLAMMRRQAVPFGSSEQHLLDALADYASISIVNARLLRAVEERARAQQQAAEAALRSGKVNIEILEMTRSELNPALASAFESLDKLVKDPTARWRPDQRQLLSNVQDQLVTMNQVAATITPHRFVRKSAEKPQTVLGEQVRAVVQKMQPFAQQNGLSVVAEMPSEPLKVCSDADLVIQILEGVLSTLIRFSSQGAMISLRMGKQADVARVAVRSSALKVNPKELDKMLNQPGETRAAGLNIRLSLVKEIVAGEGGKIWLDSETGKETVVHLSLPLY
jgi:DNA-binding response OmpR family regulator